MARSAVPTQMIIIPIKDNIQVDDFSTTEGQTWSGILDIIEKYAGFRRVYWGRHVEKPCELHLHVVRENLHQHYAFLASPDWQRVIKSLVALEVPSATALTVRHAMIAEFSPNPRSLGNGAPVTGTAIYLTPDAEAWEKTWALWTSIVSTVPGCIGVTGGWMVEPVEGNLSYVVYVGWESVAVHESYHHSKHFRRRAIVLQEHNTGFREYGHVAFTHSRVRREANL